MNCCSVKSRRTLVSGSGLNDSVGDPQLEPQTIVEIEPRARSHVPERDRHGGRRARPDLRFGLKGERAARLGPERGEHAVSLGSERKINLCSVTRERRQPGLPRRERVGHAPARTISPTPSRRAPRGRRDIDAIREEPMHVIRT